MQYNDTSTLQGIIQDIYFLGKCNGSSVSANNMLRIVNKYYGQLQEAIRSVNENFYMAVATTDLVTGDGTYSYPDGLNSSAPAYEQVRSIWAAYLPNDSTNPLTTEFQRVNIVDPDAISNPAYTFSNPTALMFGTYFVLLPECSNTTANPSLYPVTNGLKMYYIATQDRLVNDTDVPKIFPSFHDAITQGSLIDIAERLGNDKLKADSVLLFKKRLEDIRAFASARIPPEISIVEGQDGQGGWVYPWGQQSMS
jgi:hypothetical protein